MCPYFEDHKLPAGLGRASARGGVVTIAARAITAVTQLGSVLVLARLLTPEDYGLVAMVTAITGFAPLVVDFGTRDAIVQRLRVAQEEVSALFWMAFAVGCFFALLVALSGPLIAEFYGDPRLQSIALVSSLTFVAAALVSQHQALLVRTGRFRDLALVEIAANLLSSGSAIVLAYSGWQYWALVARPVALYCFMAVGVWLYCRWLPLNPALTLGVFSMLKFGSHLTGFSLTDYASKNADRVLVGRTLGAQPLGYYQSALLFYDHLLGLLVQPLHPVAVASLSKLQNDSVELRRVWSKALSTVAFYAMPAFALLAVVSRDLIVVLLGSRWENAGLILSLLALRGIPHSAERTLGWLHVPAGRTDRLLRSGIASACGHVLLLTLALPFGLTGLVCASVLFMYLAFVPTLAYAGRPFGIGAGDVIRVVGPQLTGALAAAGLGFSLQHSILANVPSVERIALLGLLTLIAYLTVVLGLFRMTTPAQVCLSVLHDYLPGQRRTSAGTSVGRLDT